MNIENLHKGDWVTVIRDLREYDVPSWVPEPQPMSGAPTLVLAISPPFVAVQTPLGRATVDTRCFELTKLDKKFVKALLGGPAFGDVVQSFEVTVNQQRDAASGRPACPRCGYDLCESIPSKSKDRRWRLYCRDCGYWGPYTDGGDEPRKGAKR